MFKPVSKILNSSTSLFLVAVVFFVVFFVLLYMDGELKKDLEDLNILTISAERVLYLDNAGTTGIRLSAGLRTDEYIQNYQDLQDDKYEVLNDFFDHSQSEQVKDAFFKMAEIQEDLEDMESEAIGLIDENNWAAAWELVTDPTFIEKKALYTKNLSAILQEIIVVSENKLEQSNNLTQITRYAVFTIFIFLSLIGFTYSREIRRSLKHERELSSSLEDMNENLEQRVQERTEELDKANQVKDEFLASMSHELRTPLTSIIGNTELLSEKVKNSEAREIVSSIQAAGNVQLNLVNDILDISKIESGMFTIEEVPFDLSHLLEDTHHILSDRAQDKGLHFILDEKTIETYQLLGDPNRIRQVLINLVGNAIKFTEYGEVRLITTVADGWLFFIVKDSGIGMSDDEQKRLFKKFQQVDGSISRRFGGSGLGLYISLNLAELMGGKVTAESQKGLGSEFTFAIPYKRSDRLATGGDAPVLSLNQQFTGSILLVEDTRPIQLVVRRLLESMGVEVTIVEHGKEALDLLEHQSFDLIFMDMLMPVMDGIEATEIIRQRGIATPVYALTANVFDKDRKRFERAGCSGFLSKPVVKKELGDVIAMHLGSTPKKASGAP